MASYRFASRPSEGEAIAFEKNALNVPNNPVIPYVEGDGTGPDIWRASVRVFDAAVAKCYGGKRKIHWMEIYAGEKSNNQFGTWLPEATVQAGALETSVIYVDSFGNLRLAGTQRDLEAALGPLGPGTLLRIDLEPPAAMEAGAATEVAAWARTFGEVPAGAPLVYVDSVGELAYADNQSSVAERLGVDVDRVVRITRA